MGEQDNAEGSDWLLVDDGGNIDAMVLDCVVHVDKRSVDGGNMAVGMDEEEERGDNDLELLHKQQLQEVRQNTQVLLVDLEVLLSLLVLLVLLVIDPNHFYHLHL